MNNANTAALNLIDAEDKTANVSVQVDWAFWIKWIASVIQILGYTATAFELTPWNAYLFLAGLLGWLTVGILWNDRAIMLIHLVALGAMLVGLFT